MEDRIRVQELLTEMSSIMIGSGKAKVSQSMRSAVERIGETTHSDCDTNLAAQRLMDFVNTKLEDKLLKKISSDVPEGILPKGCKGIIHDIRVSGYNGDDKIYNDHPDIRQKIHRGTTVLEIIQDSGKETTQDVVIYANRKFTGHIGDEDDSQPESNDQWKQYFLMDPEETQQVVCMKKINGEAAHFSARLIDGVPYIITGSKNVHMIIKEEEDIDKYVGNRYNIAQVVAKCVLNTLQSLEESHYKLLLEFMYLTKCTAICELLQPTNQHIINLSYLEEPLLNVIGFTPPADVENVSSLVAFPPHHTLDLLSSLGLTVPSHTVIQAQDVQGHMEQVRQGYHEEGEVLYFLNKDEETIGLVKTKTVWYIMLRAMREKVVYAFHTSRRQQQQQQNFECCIDSCFKRFSEIQEWVPFSDSYLEEWKNLARGFILWMEEEVREEQLKVEDIRPTYPRIWEMFLEKNNQTDVVKLQYQNVDGTKT